MSDSSSPSTVKLYDGHMHTTLCKHAKGEPEEYARTALERGLTGIIVTCHNPLPDEISLSVRMREDQFDEYVALIQRATDAMKGVVDVRMGLECDYWPGLEPYLEKQLIQARFHHVLGSVHPQLKFYQQQFPAESPLAFFKTYFTHLAMAAESGLFDTLSHPDLVKNVYPNDWKLEEVIEHIGQSLDRIAKTGVAMEFNTSGVSKAIKEYNPNQTMLTMMAQRGIPVVVGSDAHTPRRVADRFEEAIDLIRQAGYSHISYFLNRKRVDVAIDDALSVLKPVSEQPATA
jgi:histidinol-phosphatase (PHP family)